jgi:HEAT repeat protein
LSVSALGILRVQQHADYLVDLLSSPDREVVEQVVKALGKIGNPGSVKHIVEFIVNDTGKLADTAFAALKSFDFMPAVDSLIKVCGAATDKKKNP